MKASRVALFGLALIILAGAWLFAAPFGLAYQPLGAHWSTATRNDLATGGALLLIGAITLISYAALAARDLLARAPLDRPAALVGPATSAGALDDTQVVHQGTEGLAQ